MATRSENSGTGETEPALEWFARWARDRPEAPYLISAAGPVDFAAAHEVIGGFVGGLQRAFAADSRIGVVMRSDPSHVLLAAAVPLAGMTLIPLPADGPEALRRQLAGLASVVAVADPRELESARPNFVTPHPSAVHSAVFTSGSTGTPRAVRLTWANLEASAASSAEHIGHRPDDRWLAVLPLHHVAGLSILWRSAREGSAVVLESGFEVTRVASLLAGGLVTVASFVSPMLERLADSGLDRAPGFRVGLVGGGPVSGRALSVGGMLLLPTYGMTETASQVATADPAHPRIDRLVVLKGAEISIGTESRIVVDGPMVSSGDLDAPDRSGPLVTGDVGRLHDGLLEVLGRADSVIVTGGENVMPERLERIIGALPGVGDVAVVGVPDERWGSVVAVAFTGDAEPADLEARVRESVARHEIPRQWMRVDVIPMIGIGKIDRRAVAKLFR